MVIIKPYKKWLIVCFISILLVCLFHRFISRQIDFVTYSPGDFQIQDYAYHIILAKAFWFDGFGNIYDLYFQQQALSAHVGSQIFTVMPIGVTPLALFVWFPFAYVARFSMAVSYTLWIIFSVSILLVALWSVGRYVFQKQNRPPILPIMLSIVTVFSATIYFAIILGQTSVLASGLLVYLILIVYKATNRQKSGNVVVISLLICALGMKPPYVALGLGLLLIYGMWRETLYSLAIILALLMVITPILTVEWVNSYLNLLRIYSHGEFSELYAWSIEPEKMNIFRSAFRNFIGDNIAALISNFVIYGIYIAVVGLSVLVIIRGKSIDQLTMLKVTKGQLFVLLVMSYLLFAPYANGYEDVLLLSVFVMVLLHKSTLPLTNYKSFASACFLIVILYRPLGKPLLLFWTLKALILGYMLVCFPPEEKIGNVQKLEHEIHH